MKIRSTVQVNKRFGTVIGAYDQATILALEEAGREAARVASGVAATRSRTGAMADIHSTRVLPIRGARSGYDVVVYSDPYYAPFQNYGTLNSRRRKLKQPGRRKRTGEGIKPLRFMEKGRTAGRRVLLTRLAAHIRRVR